MNLDKIFKFREPKENYLKICRDNYFQKVTPGNPENKEKNGYKKLIEIAEQFFENNEYHLFSGYFNEGKYFVQLWTAHLILEYGKANEDLYKICLNEIIKYSESELSPEVALEEKEWLKQNNNNNL